MPTSSLIKMTSVAFLPFSLPVILSLPLLNQSLHLPAKGLFPEGRSTHVIPFRTFHYSSSLACSQRAHGSGLSSVSLICLFSSLVLHQVAGGFHGLQAVPSFLSCFFFNFPPTQSALALPCQPPYLQLPPSMFRSLQLLPEDLALIPAWWC